MSPLRPRKPCAVGYCAAFAAGGTSRCDKHAQELRDAERLRRRDRRRVGAWTDFYGSSAWRQLRAAFIADNPVCVHPGCGAPATDADHLLTIRERPDLALDPANLRALCHSHHSTRTAREQGRRSR